MPAPLAPAQRTRAIHLAALRHCVARGLAPVSEFPLPNGRRADILALDGHGRFHIIEVKSCARDFLADQKWPEYREFCDSFAFAVDPEFPAALIPEAAGLICAAAADDVALLRPAPRHPLPPARRRALLLRYALLAGGRLAAQLDPLGHATARAALRAE